ncbi:hypothetical protein [Hyphomicrobium sp. DY-1]|uniref:hypothetical protein n=1 Tax=Hyphomicrobium sp. DY-1 TaxID=3075650 RepID=UPI0039C156CB
MKFAAGGPVSFGYNHSPCNMTNIIVPENGIRGRGNQIDGCGQSPRWSAKTTGHIQID